MRRITSIFLVALFVFGLSSVAFADHSQDGDWPEASTDYFHPNDIQVTAGDNADGMKRVVDYSQMVWDYDESTKAFWNYQGSYIVTFEMDTVLNCSVNVENDCWAEDVTYHGSTQGTYWESNLPNPYMDSFTGAGDDYHMYTFGTFDADQIESYEHFFTIYYGWYTLNTDAGGPAEAASIAQLGEASWYCECAVVSKHSVNLGSDSTTNPWAWMVPGDFTHSQASTNGY